MIVVGVLALGLLGFMLLSNALLKRLPVRVRASHEEVADE